MKDVTVTHKRFRRNGLEFNCCVVSYPYGRRYYREFWVKQKVYRDYKRLAQVVAAMLRNGATDNEVNDFMATQAWEPEIVKLLS